MNSSSSQQPVKSPKNTPLRAGQIPTMHDLLDWETVDSLGDELEAALADLEAKFANYVTTVSLKKESRR